MSESDYAASLMGPPGEMSAELDWFVRALMRRLLDLHNAPDVNVLTPQDLVWQLVKAINAAHGGTSSTPAPRQIVHAANCPAGGAFACTCGAEKP